MQVINVSPAFFRKMLTNINCTNTISTVDRTVK